MSKKPKFRPEITRIKLNPEQAVLSCSCQTTGNRVITMSGPTTSGRSAVSGSLMCGSRGTLYNLAKGDNNQGLGTTVAYS